MKIFRSKSPRFFGFALLFLGGIASWKSGRAGVADDFDMIRAELQASLSQSRDRRLSLVPAEGEFCSIRQFCEILKPQRNQFYLYSNLVGEKFPNLRLLENVVVAQSCHRVKFREEARALSVAKGSHQKEKEAALPEADREELQKWREEYRLRQVALQRERDSRHSRELDEALESEMRRRIQSIQELIDSVDASGESALLTDFKKVLGQVMVSRPRVVDASSRFDFFSDDRPALFFDPDKYPPSSRTGVERFNALAFNWMMEDLVKKRKYTYGGGYVHVERLSFDFPSVIFDLRFAADATVRETQVKELYSGRARVLRVLEKARRGIVAQLEQGKVLRPSAEDQWDRMIRRVETVQLSLTVDKKVCKKSSPAHYDPLAHMIQICPWLFDLPESALLQIVAHEVTHAIDPCNVSYDLWGQDGKRVVDRTETLRADAKTTLLVSGIPFDKNPFEKVLMCLQSPTSIQVSLRGERSHRDRLEKEHATLFRQGKTRGRDPEVDRVEKVLTDFSHQFSVHQACDSLTTVGSQVSEAFADWMAGRVVAIEVASASAEGRREKAFEATLFFLDQVGVCGPDDSTAPVAQTRRLLKSLGCSFPMEREGAPTDPDFMASHPPSDRRITDILLREPVLRGALGCATETAEGLYCDLE